MKHLVEGNDTQFEWLRDQIQGMLYIFDNIALPGTCSPKRCRLGFEFTPSKGYTLYIDKNISYTGAKEDFKTLLSNGEISFEKFEDMVRFVRGCNSLYTEEAQLARIRAEVNQVFPREVASPDTQETQSETVYQTARLPIIIDEQQLYDDLTLQIIGQSKALVGLSNATMLHLAKPLPKRPATLFLSGPTGVGKTESVNVLVESLKNITDVPFELIRIDCNTMEEGFRVSQVLGAPPGYVGYNDPPLLAPLLKNPRCVVLWDEIEKAHPSILKALMNAMDTGRMPLSSPIDGENELDCRHSIFIFTSNLALNTPAKKMGFRTDAEEFSTLFVSDEDKMKEALVKNNFLPEIAGRIACFLQYTPLSQEDIKKIVQLEIIKTAREYGLSVTTIDEEIVSEIVQLTGSQFGVRAYKQMIEKRMGKAFARGEGKVTSIAINGNLDALEMVPCSHTPAQPE